MRRRSLSIAFFSLVTILIGVSVFHVLSVFARRPIRTLASSVNGGSLSSFCADNATPFVAALTGKVSTDGTCIDFTSGIYPDHTQSLAASDQSFTLKVTPVLWENGASGTSTRQTILHLEFASTNANLKLTSFVIGGLVITPAANPPEPPGYVVCSINLNPPSPPPPPTPIYPLLAIFDSSSSTTTTVCTDASLTFNDASGNPTALEPSPIQFSDGAATRWDIHGISGGASGTHLSSIDLLVAGFPADLTDAINIDVDGGPSTPSNNLIRSFVQNPNNFLAVAVDSQTGKVETAGGLSVPSVTSPLTNDSIGSATAVDPFMAITTGFTDQVNASTAQPQQDSAGNLTNAPTNPADPTIPTNCFDGGGGSAALLRTVWYSFTPVGDGSVTVDTAGSRYDTVVAIFTGTPGTLTMVTGGCADDFQDANQAVHLQAKLSNIQLTHGTTYFILAGESPTKTGTLIGADGNPVTPAVPVAAPLSNDATLFFSLIETPTPPGISLAPVSNTALSFGGVQAGTTSTFQTVTVTSTGGKPLSISNISVPTGFNATGCSTPVAQGASCTINVNFQPSSTGTVSGSLTFADNVSGSTPSYPISGTGTDYTFPQPSQTASLGTPMTSTTPATFSLNVSGSASFSGSITFACQNLPANTTCTFSQNPATPGSGGNTPITLTLSRISTATLNPTESLLQASTSLIFLLLIIPIIVRNRNWNLPRRLCTYGFFLSVLVLMWACGGGTTNPPPPPPQPLTGSYPFTVTATVSGAPPKAINLTLVVQ